MKAPDDFKSNTGNPLGKAPSLQDGDLTIYESGAITEYLCETYDEENRLIPKDVKERIKVLQWIHASEATFMLHGLAITYARWTIPKEAQESGVLEQAEKGLSVNVQKDLDWLETELSLSPGKFLCGDKVTAEDMMMQFSIDFILTTKLGTQGKTWPNIAKWLKTCAETDSYKLVVKKTGYELSHKMPETK